MQKNALSVNELFKMRITHLDLLCWSFYAWADISTREYTQ